MIKACLGHIWGSFFTIPMETFEKLEKLLENYALVRLMEEDEGGETLSAQDAKSYYDQLEKAQ